MCDFFFYFNRYKLYYSRKMLKLNLKIDFYFYNFYSLHGECHILFACLIGDLDRVQNSMLLYILFISFF